ncbi:MAG: hypothetical protein ABW199_03120 [Caulobacterales bacterium]
MKTALLSIAAMASLAACATSAAEPQRWAGIYTFQFETSSIRPDGSSENWWVSSADEHVQAQLRHALEKSGARPPWGRARVTIEGNLSAPGHYGHMAAYDHEIDVTRVVSSQALSPREDN